MHTELFWGLRVYFLSLQQYLELYGTFTIIQEVFENLKKKMLKV